MKQILLALLLVSTSVFAATKECKVYDWPITRVIDGDTIKFEAPWLPDPLKKEQSIRVLGVDTPEKGHRAQCDKEKKAGEAATKFTKELVKNGKKIQVKFCEADKYGGRWLGDIIIDGKSLSEQLIASGNARPYFGEKKSDWCK